MRETTFWSALGRGAVLAAAAMATAGVAGCSGSRFDSPAYDLSNTGGGYDGTTTASLGPVPPEPVYGSGGSNAYASATPPRATPGFDSTGAYRAGNSNSSNTYRATPVAYRPNDNANRYVPPRSSAPLQPAVYTPPAPQPPAMSSRRTASADRAALTGPGSKTITVQNGDSLYLYSLRYGVSVESIQKANNLSGIGLTAGQKIIIPAKGSTVGDDTYIIQAGDSLNSIAKKHGVSEQALASANNISDARGLQIGQELKIPAGGRATAPTVQAQAQPKASPPAPKDSAASGNVRVVRTQEIKPPDFAQKDAAGQKTASSTSESSGQIASTKSLPAPDPMSGQSFRWPVNGKVISKFGARADGGHNDGIDVSVPQGTAVKAAENGVVAYAGNELKGYGNLVLIRHSNNWVSAYAHNEDLLVKRGDKVTRGQTIAKAGATGSVSQPQLHFELRKGSRPVDPLKYLGTATAGAN